MALPSIDKPFGADEGFVLSAKLSKTVSHVSNQLVSQPVRVALQKSGMLMLWKYISSK